MKKLSNNIHVFKATAAAMSLPFEVSRVSKLAASVHEDIDVAELTYLELVCHMDQPAGTVQGGDHRGPLGATVGAVTFNTTGLIQGKGVSFL